MQFPKKHTQLELYLHISQSPQSLSRTKDMTSTHLTKSLIKFSILAILILASNNGAAMTRLSRVATQAISCIKPSLKKNSTTISNSPICGFNPRFISTHEAYNLFGVSPYEKPTPEQLKVIYRKLLLANHPDRNPNDLHSATKKTQDINAAFSILTEKLKNNGNDSWNNDENDYSQYQNNGWNNNKWDYSQYQYDYKQYQEKKEKEEKEKSQWIAWNCLCAAVTTLVIIDLLNNNSAIPNPFITNPVIAKAFLNNRDKYSQPKLTTTSDNGLLYIAVAGLTALIIEFAILEKLFGEKKSFPFIMQYMPKDSLIKKQCAAQNSNLSPEVLDAYMYIENVLASLEKGFKDGARGLPDSFAESLAPFTNFQKIESAINIVLPKESKAVKQKELVLIINAAKTILTTQKSEHCTA